jgi:hypothetical protein
MAANLLPVHIAFFSLPLCLQLADVLAQAHPTHSLANEACNSL